MIGCSVKGFIGILLALMCILLFTQVVTRYVFVVSLPWLEESARYGMITLTFLGAAMATRERIHIRVDVLPLIIRNQRAKDLITIGVDSVGLILLGILIWVSWGYMQYAWGISAYTTFGMHLGIPKSAFFFGSVLMAGYLTAILVEEVQAFRKRYH